jgi:transposase
VKFFEMLGGCHREIVYDNMKNVVSKFIGRNEKELNPDLVKMSMYYGFQINVTNCFAGNEKGMWRIA